MSKIFYVRAEIWDDMFDDWVVANYSDHGPTKGYRMSKLSEEVIHDFVNTFDREFFIDKFGLSPLSNESSFTNNEQYYKYEIIDEVKVAEFSLKYM